jgi:hypothetical protein
MYGMAGVCKLYQKNISAAFATQGRLMIFAGQP